VNLFVLVLRLLEEERHSIESPTSGKEFRNIELGFFLTSKIIAPCYNSSRNLKDEKMQEPYFEQESQVTQLMQRSL